MADTRSVTVNAAFVAIVVAFAAGWLTRRWRSARTAYGSHALVPTLPAVGRGEPGCGSLEL